MRHKGLFVAIFACVFAMFYQEPTLLTGLLCGYWLVRLVCYRHKKIVLSSLLVGVLIVMRSGVFQTPTRLDSQQTAFDVWVFAHSIEVNGDRLKGMGQVNGEPVIVYVRLHSPQEKVMWQTQTHDKYLRVKAVVETLSKPKNPNQFDYRRYMKEMRDVTWQLHIESYQVLSQQLNVIASWQKRLKEVLPQQLYAWVNSLIFSHTDDTLSETFATVGLLHVVSASGMHVGITLEWLRYIGKRMGVTHETMHKVSRACALVLYAMNPNSIGVQKYVILCWLPKRWRYLDKLAAACVLLLVYRPYAIWTLAFQLTFFIPVVSRLSRRNPLLIWLATCPILSFHVFEISIVPLVLSPVAYMLLKKVIMPVMWGVAIMAVCAWEGLRGAFVWLDVVLVHLTNVMTWVAQQSYLRIVTGRHTPWRYVGIVIVLMLLIKCVGVKSRKRIVYSVVFIALVCMKIPETRVVMIDVGQGNSFFIQDGYDTMLIDTGGQVVFPVKEKWKEKEKPMKNIADTTVIPVLKSLGIGTIETLVLTHDDIDHTGGAERLKQEVIVKRVIVGNGAKTPATKQVIAGQRLPIGRFDFQVLSPTEKGTGENDDSVVLFGRFGRYTWLFMGDAGVRVEDQLLKKYPNLTADILQIGHHGSRTATSRQFLERIKPKVALVSVGTNNRFGHPHPEVLQHLQQIPLYRTDQQGAVSYDEKQNVWQTHQRE